MPWFDFWPERRRTDADPEAAISQVFKFNLSLVPNLFERTKRCSPRLGLSLLKLVDGPLRQTNPPTKLALAPAENGPGQANLGGKCMSFELNERTQIVRTRREMRNH